MSSSSFPKAGYDYVIGDLQGCYDAFMRLLDEINFNPKQDKLWLAGDLVARGEDSLSTLRQVKKFNEQGCAYTVLGNHDINLLAVWRGHVRIKKKDKTVHILLVHDTDDLMNWLRKQPLILQPNKSTVMTHAGIPFHWSISQAKRYAKEVETALQADMSRLDKVLPNLYSKRVDRWSESLTGYDRLRAITNYFTRMRLCDASGNLEFSFSSGIDEKMPKGFKPWFYWERQRKQRIFFGHWAGLQAKIATPLVCSTDAGCVWGGKLLAYRLNDDKVFSVNG